MPNVLTDLLPIIPGFVRVNFRDGTGIAVALNDLALPEFVGVVVNSNTHVLEAFAPYQGVTTGFSTVTPLALARQIAQDWYLWQLGKLDQVFAGVAAWVPDALHTIEFEHTGLANTSDAKITTRVQRDVAYPMTPGPNEVAWVQRLSSAGKGWFLTSTTPQTITSAGLITFTFDPTYINYGGAADLSSAGAHIGDPVVISDGTWNATGGNQMRGALYSYTSTTATFAITSKTGSGTFSSWTIKGAAWDPTFNSTSSLTIVSTGNLTLTVDFGLQLLPAAIYGFDTGDVVILDATSTAAGAGAPGAQPYQQWNGNSTYNAGDNVSWNFRNYVCNANGTSGLPEPENGIIGSVPTWTELSPLFRMTGFVTTYSGTQLTLAIQTGIGLGATFSKWRVTVPQVQGMFPAVALDKNQTGGAFAAPFRPTGGAPCWLKQSGYSYGQIEINRLYEAIRASDANGRKIYTVDAADDSGSFGITNLTQVKVSFLGKWCYLSANSEYVLLDFPVWGDGAPNQGPYLGGGGSLPALNGGYFASFAQWWAGYAVYRVYDVPFCGRNQSGAIPNGIFDFSGTAYPGQTLYYLDGQLNQVKFSFPPGVTCAALQTVHFVGQTYFGQPIILGFVGLNDGAGNVGISKFEIATDSTTSSLGYLPTSVANMVMATSTTVGAAAITAQVSLEVRSGPQVVVSARLGHLSQGTCKTYFSVWDSAVGELLGLYGTDSIGNTFSGGLLTSLGNDDGFDAAVLESLQDNGGATSAGSGGG